METLKRRIGRITRTLESLARSGRLDARDSEFSNVLGQALVAHPDEARALQSALAVFVDRHPDLSGAELVEAPGFEEAIAPLFERLVDADEGLTRYLAGRAQEAPGGTKPRGRRKTHARRPWAAL